MPADTATDWRALAACREADGDLFFPEAAPGTPAFDLQVAEAQQVCARCPVSVQCDAVSHGEVYGIWAGRTEGERRDATRKQRRRDQRASARERRAAA